jgi:hypothetical protein
MALINPAATAITSKLPSACLAIPEASGKPGWPLVPHRGRTPALHRRDPLELKPRLAHIGSCPVVSLWVPTMGNFDGASEAGDVTCCGVRLVAVAATQPHISAWSFSTAAQSVHQSDGGLTRRLGR